MTYKRAMALGAVASLAYIAIRLLILNALYAEQTSVGGLAYEQATTWAIFAGLLLMVIWVPWAHDFPEAIRSGTIVGDLLRPVHTFSLQLARQAGRLLALLLIRTFPIIGAAVVFLPISTPNGAVGWLCLAASLLLVVINSTAYMYVLGSTAFFTADYYVWMAFAFFVMQFWGGMFVPIEFIPGVLGTIAEWGPGMAFVAAPTRIVNDLHPVRTLAAQAMWAFLFSAAAYMTLHLGRKRLVMHGG